jgi:hypothetical protein
MRDRGYRSARRKFAARLLGTEASSPSDIIRAMSSSTDWVTAIATAFAAIGTVGTLVAALWQIRRERETRKRQERRAQAERVSGWPVGFFGGVEEPKQPIALVNGSGEPVYRAVAWLVFIEGAAPHTGREMQALMNEPGIQVPLWRSLLSHIPPGKHETSVGGGWAGMYRRPGVELAFTDRAGVHWLRSADGTLTEIKQPAVEYYGIDGPYDWRVPDPE